MKAGVLSALIAGAVAGVVGFGIGRRSADRPQIPHQAPVPAVAETVAKGTESPKTETVAQTPSPGPAPEAGNSTSVEPLASMSPKDRLFALLIPHLSEDKKHSALWGAVVGNPEMQRRVFNLLMASDDRAFHEAGQDLLISIRDPELLKEVLSAFASETNPDRRAMLAYALGGNGSSEEARATIQSILAAGDNRLMGQVLKRLTVQGSGRSDNMEYVPQLRHLVLNGPTPEIRSGAARSLRGDRTEEGIQFLIDRMLNDKDADVAYAAMVALPVTYSGGGQHEEVQYRNLLEVALDESRSPKMRKWAADRALMGAFRFRDLMTEEQKALMTKLAEKTGPGPVKGKP